MKIRSITLYLCALAAMSLCLASAHAAEKKVAGPNGGRILTKSEPRAEFFVTADRRVQITFLDSAGKPIAPAGQTVIVVSGERSAPQTLMFIHTGQALLSTTPLPAGSAVPTVVQIKPTPTTPSVTERFNVDLSTCSECKLSEYACICAH